MVLVEVNSLPPYFFGSFLRRNRPGNLGDIVDLGPVHCRYRPCPSIVGGERGVLISPNWTIDCREGADRGRRHACRD